MSLDKIKEKERDAFKVFTHDWCEEGMKISFEMRLGFRYGFEAGYKKKIQEDLKNFIPDIKISPDLWASIRSFVNGDSIGLEAISWVVTPNPHFEDKSPLEMLYLGREAEIKAFIQEHKQLTAAK